MEQSRTAGATRREFLGKTGTGLATGRVLGASDRINIGFVGCGMRFQALLRMFKAREAAGEVNLTAVCDVWEPRLRFAQERSGAAVACRDYRDVLARPEIDGVVLAVPDHWHCRLAADAIHAGKDVYLEKPMTKTVDEAAVLHELVGKKKKVLQVGGTGPANALLWKINEFISAGKMGKIVCAQASYNRNARTGVWDYPIPGTGDSAWPDAEISPGKNLDWRLWLGPARSRPYSDERFFRWRKYWEYSGGNATDLLYHVLGTISTMVGFEFPTRAVAAGGIYVQKNREVPDTYITTVEYPGDYAVNMISCMANSSSTPVTVYGNWGTLELSDSGATVKAQARFIDEFKSANDGKTTVTMEAERGPDLVQDWLKCMRTRGTPLYSSLRGYQVMAAIKLGVDSYRFGRVMAFDPATRRVLSAPPRHREYAPVNG